jgi:recombination protein RecR
MLPEPIENLITAFQMLPGIGRKSAERLAFFVLNAPAENIDQFMLAISDVKNSLTTCKQCFNIADDTLCKICDDKTRDHSTICVVENPLDVIALEKSGTYKGLYHVLGGALSPADGVGPDQLKISELFQRLKKPVKEIILATNPSLEGEATAMYIQKELKSSIIDNRLSIKISRIARGLPVGASIEYADEITLRQAMEGRREY